MNEFTFSELEVGREVSFRRIITREMEEYFRIVSGDENPLHQDDEFARTVSNGRYERHVVFGMLTASLYSALAGMYLPGKYSLIHSFDELAFLNPVFAGDELTVEGRVADKDEALGLIRLKAVIKNQDDRLVSRAKLKVLVMK